MEFEQYRSYEPGDEPRRIDWKLYGRSDRCFVREAARDSPLTIWILIDASASMTQADARRPDYSKLAAAKLIAACLGEIAESQGDAYGLIGLSGAGARLLPAGSGLRHRDRLWLALDTIDPSGNWPDEAGLRPVWERIEPAALVVILSDGFDPALPLLAARLAAAHRQVLSLGLLSCEERDFPFTGGFIFRDPETGAECRVDGAAARDEFLARFRNARLELERRLTFCGVRHVDHYLDEPPELPLHRLLGGEQRGPA